MKKELFAKRLKKIRKKHNMSQLDLARCINVSKVTISYYENAKRMPCNATLKSLSNCLDVSIDYLLGNRLYKDTSSDEKQILNIIEKSSHLKSFLLTTPESVNILESYIKQINE